MIREINSGRASVIVSSAGLPLPHAALWLAVAIEVGAGLALLVCYPCFTVQPELITLVGIAAVLWLTLEAEESRQPRFLWMTVAVIWISAQFDIRAFLGWMLLMSFALGETLRRGEDAASRRALARQIGRAHV